MTTMTANAIDTIVKTYTTIRNELKTELVERGIEIDLLTACVVARVHMLLLGEAGTAKSMLVDQFFAHIENAQKFDILLSKNTLPEEVFGPPSMVGLENDEFRFVTTGMLPEAELAFLDEIFKCNSAVLNGMLKIANERKFKANGGWMEVPLWMLAGASNEVPTHDREDLMAFNDRLGVRKIVLPVRAQDSIMEVLEGQLARNRGEEVANTHTTISTDDIETLQAKAAEVIVPSKVQRALADLRMKAENTGLNFSLRRMFEGVKVCQANALLNGRNEVRTEDLRIFEYVIPTDPDDFSTASELTLDFAGAVGRKAAQMRTEYEEVQQQFADVQKQMPADGVPGEDVLDVLTKVSAKFNAVNKRVDAAIQEANDNAWDPTELESVLAEVKRSRQSVRELIGIGD